MGIHRLHATNLWDSIDEIAKETNLSLPRLALKAGLDQSTFSHARRKRNWMSLRTLASVLNATGITVREWARMVDDTAPDPEAKPNQTRGDHAAEATQDRKAGRYGQPQTTP